MKNTKEVYIKPELTVHGGISEITESVQNSGGEDGVYGDGSQGS